jgi:hypothetical protein
MNETEDIIGQKVSRVMIMVELENGKTLVANPTEIGNIDELVTLKELQRALSNSENDEYSFLSPFVFMIDVQDAGRRWIKSIYEDKKRQGGRFWTEYEKGKLDFIKHFFNLEEER